MSTLCYLVTFFDKDKKNLVSFENENRVINRSYIKAFMDIASGEENADYWINMIHSENPSYFKDGRLKSNKELREFSSDKYFDKVHTKSSKLTEMDKFNRIRQFNFNFPQDPFFLWKLFSQYEHYSLASTVFYSSGSEPQTDVTFYNVLISTAYIETSVSLIFEILDVEREQLINMQVKIDDILEKIQSK